MIIFIPVMIVLIYYDYHDDYDDYYDRDYYGYD